MEDEDCKQLDDSILNSNDLRDFLDNKKGNKVGIDNQGDDINENEDI